MYKFNKYHMTSNKTVCNLGDFKVTHKQKKINIKLLIHDPKSLEERKQPKGNWVSLNPSFVQVCCD